MFSHIKRLFPQSHPLNLSSSVTPHHIFLIQFFFFLVGPLLGSPVQDMAIILHSLIIHPGTSTTMISACVSRCVHKV